MDLSELISNPREMHMMGVSETNYIGDIELLQILWSVREDRVIFLPSGASLNLFKSSVYDQIA